MKTIWVLGVTSALALGGLSVHGVWRARAADAANVEQRAVLAEVRDELTQLARERDEAARALRTARTLAGAAVAPRGEAMPVPRAEDEVAAAGDLEPAESEADPEEEAKAHRLEFQDSLEAAFATESYDAGWAHGAEDQAEELVRASLPAGSAVRAVDCRQTLCRVELDHQDVQSHREFVGHFDERTQWGGPSAILFDETVPGKVATIAYLGRKDVPFPSVEQTQL